MPVKDSDLIRARLLDSLRQLESADDILAAISAAIGQALNCDRAVVVVAAVDPINATQTAAASGLPLFHWVWIDPQSSDLKPSGRGHFSLGWQCISLHGAAQRLPLVVSDTSDPRLDEAVGNELQEHEVKSFCLVPLRVSGLIIGWFEVHFCEERHRWLKSEIAFLEQLGHDTHLALQRAMREVATRSAVTSGGGTQESVLRSRYMTNYGDLLIIRTNTDFVISDIQGDTERIIGLRPGELLRRRDVWAAFVHPADLRNLLVKARPRNQCPLEISEEVRIVNRTRGETRWFLVKAVPLFSAGGVFIGWEGFGLDIDEKKRAESDLVTQSRRVEALYEVSRSIQINSEPAFVMLHGLRALIRATSSCCGLACSYSPDNGQIEIIAAEGLSAHYMEEVGAVINADGLTRQVIEKQTGIISDDLQHDVRAAADLARSEKLKSAILCPVIFEGRPLGAIAIFKRRARGYRQADLELVEAAAGQIAVAMRQAELFEEQKLQSRSMAALYRLSHELAHAISTRGIVESAFPVIQEEFACRRMWLGVINEQGTHLVGQGGFGPGVRGRLLDLQVELGERHDHLDEALRSKQAVIVQAGSKMDCSGLNSLMRRLRAGVFVIVPLVSLGQTIGALIVEPAVPAAFFAQKKLPFLSSMANEIATVFMSRRFESKLADADKMRMARVLASGVAHNFNNLLQAVMGQASLIEMQSAPESPLVKAARNIIDSAGKGASLVKQMLGLTSQSGEKKAIETASMLNESRSLYESVLGAGVRLEISVDADAPEIFGDLSEIQQVITNLMVNAREAIGQNPQGLIKLQASRVRLRSGEVDPQLAPGIYLRLDLEDNGVGMDPEKLARCFEPFFTTKNADAGTGLGLQGSGLGLSFAYTMVRQYDGIITARSQKGQGSVFSVYLPSVTVGATGLARPPRPDGISAVIVDPARGLGTSIQFVLESSGIGARVFSDKDRAFEFIGRSNGAVRILMLDADRSGYDVPSYVKFVRSRTSDLIIVVATVEERRWKNLIGNRMGVTVVKKPLGFQTLRSLLAGFGYQLPGTRLADKIEMSVEKPLAAQADAEGAADDKEPGEWLKKGRRIE